MFKYFLMFFLSAYSFNVYSQRASDATIELARKFSRDLFETNGVLYMDPVVKIINSTSNSRFYSGAYIPSKNIKPYYRVSANLMTGIVNDNFKYYSPVLPGIEYNANDLQKFVTYDFFQQKITYLDTAGLIHYVLMNMLFDGNKSGQIQVPPKASTTLGTGNTLFMLSHDVMQTLLIQHPLYALPFIPQSLKDTISSQLNQFPDKFTLYGGNNLDVVYAGIPQFEFGSVYGTEFLVRMIPPIYLGRSVGDFAFWGLGIKHSISQYFFDDFDASGNPLPASERPFDMAAQFVYQGTYLKNEIGATNSKLNALATIFSFNLQASKRFEGVLDIFTGLSYETIDIQTEYTYTLDKQVQKQLGLLEYDQENPTPGYPGDTNPQTTKLPLEAENVRWTIGINKPIGNFDIFLDYSISKFDILSGGIQYRF